MKMFWMKLKKTLGCLVGRHQWRVRKMFDIHTGKMYEKYICKNCKKCKIVEIKHGKH